MWDRPRRLLDRQLVNDDPWVLAHAPHPATTDSARLDDGAEPDAVFQSSSSTQSRVLVTALRQRA